MRFFLTGLLLAPILVYGGETYHGKVIGVTDGDTLTLLLEPENRPIKVRLAGIDTPERGQPWASKARRALSDLAYGKEVRVVHVDIDRYSRRVGRVYVGDTDVNAELIRGGHAWVYRKYVTEDKLFALEKKAKAGKRGLWALPEAQIPPWDWRKGIR